MQDSFPEYSQTISQGDALRMVNILNSAKCSLLSLETTHLVF